MKKVAVLLALIALLLLAAGCGNPVGKVFFIERDDDAAVYTAMIFSTKDAAEQSPTVRQAYISLLREIFVRASLEAKNEGLIIVLVEFVDGNGSFLTLNADGIKALKEDPGREFSLLETPALMMPAVQPDSFKKIPTQGM